MGISMRVSFIAGMSYFGFFNFLDFSIFALKYASCNNIAIVYSSRKWDIWDTFARFFDSRGSCMETGNKKVMGLDLSNAKKIIEADNKVIISGLAKGRKLPATLRNDIEEAIALESEEDFRGNAKSWSDLAILLGISRRTLLRKRKDPNAPQGYGDVEAWVKFLNGSESDNSLKRLNEARLRILNAQAAEREFRLKVLEGKYVEIDDVRETWSAHIHRAIALMRSKFENELPPVYTLEPVANMKLNQEAIDEICRTMSDGGKYTP
jgi:hypothetical protein